MAGLGRKVFTAGDVLTASDVQNYLMDQTVMVFAGTAARSSAIATPTEGMLATRTDLDQIDYYNGSAWVSALPLSAWTTYTPTVSSTTGSITSYVVNRARYAILGKTVHLNASVTITNNGTGGGVVSVTLPSIANSFTVEYVGSGRNTSTGAFLSVFGQAAGNLYISTVTNTYPVATGQAIYFSVTYESA